MNINKWDYRKWSVAAMAVWLIACVCWFAVTDKSSLSFYGGINTVTGIVTMASLFMLAMICAMDQSKPDKATSLYYILLWIIMTGTFVDHFAWMFDTRLDLIRLTVFFIMIDYMVIEILAFLLWFYQEALYPSEERKYNWIPVFLKVFLVMNLVYILWGTVTGFIFYIDDQNRYATGPGYLLLFLFPLITVLLNIYCNLKRTMPGRVRIALIVFNVFPITFSCMAIILPDYSIIYVILMMNMVFIYGTIQMERSQERLEQVEKISQQQRDLVEKQTQMMVSQIQPHFLYNALNAIYYLCGKDTKQARMMILRFSDYLRVNMDSIKSKEAISFEKELTHTKTYLEIELVRFGNILNVEYDIQVTDFVLPALSLQPLVENAVKYGIRGREDGGTVTISTRREGNYIYITVTDDGIGFDPEHLPEDGRSHVGIENVKSRLHAMCGGRLQIESIPGHGTTATMILEEDV